MKKGVLFGSAIVLVGVAVAAGYWWGTSSRPATNGSGEARVAVADGKPARKLVHYRNPMGLPDTSPVPKKDPMGMAYIGVYEGEEPETATNQLKISVDKVQKLGVRTEPAILQVLDRLVRAAGRIEVDERRVYAIAPKFEGWVERLHVNVTGQQVSRGQALFDVYSPELVSAQREYAIATDASRSLKDANDGSQASMNRLAESSLARLRNWDIPPEQIRTLAQSGESRRTLTFRSPVSGVVMEKKALQGMRFMPGDSLFQIADLSSVWVIADVYEQDLASVKVGERASVRISAYPERSFSGRITFIYPTLKQETRTVPVRIELPNPGGLLKPAMFAQVELSAGSKEKVVAVPTSAVIDSGTRQIVLLDKGQGRFEPREVKVGRRSDTFVELMEGVREGEPVVVAANFLIDAESNLKAAIGGFGHAGHAGNADTQRGAPASVGHRAEGTVDAIDPATRMVSIAHGPVESLKWPAMTMEFKLANDSLRPALKPGSAVSFEFVERAQGEWVITKAQTARVASAPAVPGHQGH